MAPSERGAPLLLARAGMVDTDPTAMFGDGCRARAAFLGAAQREMEDDDCLTDEASR